MIQFNEYPQAVMQGNKVAFRPLVERAFLLSEIQFLGRPHQERQPPAFRIWKPTLLAILATLGLRNFWQGQQCPPKRIRDCLPPFGKLHEALPARACNQTSARRTTGQTVLVRSGFAVPWHRRRLVRSALQARQWHPSLTSSWELRLTNATRNASSERFRFCAICASIRESGPVGLGCALSYANRALRFGFPTLALDALLLWR